MVIKYKNEILRKYDYIDVVLVSRTTITDFEDLKSLNKTNQGNSVFMFLQNQKFRAFNGINLASKPKINIRPASPDENTEKRDPK